MMKLWSGLCLLLAGVLVGLIVTAWLRPFKNYSEVEKVLWIAPRTSSQAIAIQLEQEGVIRHRLLFLLYVKTLKWSSHLQAGEYRFQNFLTIPEVADRLIQGLVHYRELTIPEGHSLFEIPELLSQAGLIPSKTFAAAFKNVDLIADLAPDARNLEGFLFPDTYQWTRQTLLEDLIRQMTERFREVVSSHLLSKIDENPFNLKQVVTLASLIEKETAVDSERPLVSAVFHNRLTQRIPLQCDPTVIYATKLRGTFRGKIFQSDLDFDSPYNTYSVAGLPPGPIANPGLKSLQAAVQPAKVKYLYFVSDNQGGHVFSETLSQHQRAVTKYRRALRNGKGLSQSKKVGS